MKKLIKAVIALGVVIMLAAVAVPFLIPAEAYKSQVLSLLARVTGRDITIGGSLEFSLLPNPRLVAQDVMIANPKGFSRPDMAHLRELALEVELAPLFDKKLVVKSFVLKKPEVFLEKNAAGQTNWEFTRQAAIHEAEKPENNTEKSSLGSVSLGDISVVDGGLSWRDESAKKSTKIQLTALNLDLNARDFSKPLSLKLDARWNDLPLSLSLKVNTLARYFDGQAAEIEAKATLDDALFRYNGSLDKAMRAGGDMALDVPSLNKLSGALRGEAALPADMNSRLKADAKMKLGGDSVALSDLALHVGSIDASGNLAIGWGGPRPVIGGGLSVGTIDLSAIMPKPPSAAGGSGGGAPKASGWSAEPIDFSGLNVVDVSLSLALGGVTYDKVTIGKINAIVKIAAGLLTVNVEDAELYNGHAKGQLTVNASGKPYIVQRKVEAAGLDARALLADAFGFDRLSGTLEATSDMTARGNSLREMIGNLNGAGAVKFTDGSIRGIDLAAMIRNVQAAFLNAGDDSAKTNFTELSGSFKVTNGIAHNDDLVMKAPLFRLSGAGDINLPAQSVAYRLVPKLVASLEGQGAQGEASGLAVPVKVEGTFDKLHFRPDLEGVIKNAIEDPKALKNTVKDFKNLLKGKPAEPAPASVPTATAPTNAAPVPPAPKPSKADKINNLLNNLGVQ